MTVIHAICVFVFLRIFVFVYWAWRRGGNDSNPCSYHRLFNNISRTETPLYKEQDGIMMIPTSLRSFALASIYRADDVLTR